VKIVKGHEPITVEHPVTILFGEPGIGKTTLAYSASRPLLIDADQGAHRARNRRDTLQVTSWSDIEELSGAKSFLADYDTLVGDTVGRIVDLMAADIIDSTPKYGSNGALTLQGYGVLKSRFATWLTRLRAMGKDVVLIAHHKEDKSGDVVIVRPDVTGGSYHEILKLADFVGFLSMQDKRRVLDFNPTDRWVGKNPAGWPPFVIPPAAEATDFLAGLIAKGRAALGAISAEHAQALQVVEDWRTMLDGISTADECTRAISEAQAQPTAIATQLKRLLLDRATALGFTFNKAAKKFVGPEPEPEPVGAAAGADPELGF
jgi:hypothetical protein